MCGRMCCSLNPDTLGRACDYKDGNGKLRTTSWTNSDVKYFPSCNIGPKDVVPCLVAGSHFAKNNERVLCSMMWSMIPPWHEGDYRKHTMSTHNARLENLKTSTMYAPPLRKGYRCIVVCEGYYEWKAGKTKKEAKQPYYIYATQEKGVRMDDPITWKDEWSEESGWKGIKVLKMAGIFNRFKTGEGKTIYSCTIVTTDSKNSLSSLHNRVPVFLKTEEDTHVWLNEDLSLAQAVDRLSKATVSEGDLSWHTVSTLVNNVTHKSEDCRKETKAVEEKKSNPNSFMASWLNKGTAASAKRKSINTDDDHSSKSRESDKTPSKIAKK
ncbi:PREDICTED: embryonic stem cell-specific 5-hydroxymethylcytosine-binding protein [Dufourea novaeangliae]|uniref:embryonic stem cell-specific 5-hydroxymethylcytosine-binding protein n=1 Tax=Dufourea novaeangliae TaxID=178035 RepID=UPI000767912F|nr:PREDICTED: embryonic stem cell-specific 5-hydroxymethylcytosine-binding protein [Dufourea novaeangliae]